MNHTCKHETLFVTSRTRWVRPEDQPTRTLSVHRVGLSEGETYYGVGEGSGNYDSCVWSSDEKTDDGPAGGL